MIQHSRNECREWEILPQDALLRARDAQKFTTSFHGNASLFGEKRIIIFDGYYIRGDIQPALWPREEFKLLDYTLKLITFLQVYWTARPLERALLLERCSNDKLIITDKVKLHVRHAEFCHHINSSSGVWFKIVYRLVVYNV